VGVKKLNVGLVQQSCTADREENIAKSVAGVREAAAKGAELVVLQELHRSLYFCQGEDICCFDLAEPIPGPSTELFGALARELGVVIVASLFERRGPGLYHNTAVVLEKDGSIAGRYRKMHIPDDPAYYEKFYFTPGDLGFEPIATSVGRLGLLVCWDQWFPEAARITALMGAQVLFYPTAIGWHPAEKAEFGAAQRDAWLTMQRSHAIANGCYVAAVNRVGHERETPDAVGLEFWGTTFLCDPYGVVVAQAATDREETLVAPVDLAKVQEMRRHWPFLRDRRVDAYGDLTRRFRD
jgi:N-carbamoylputrescine amidase